MEVILFMSFLSKLFTNYLMFKNENYIKNYKPTHKVYTLKAIIYSKPNNKTKTFLPSKTDLEDIRQANAIAPEGSKIKLNS